MNAAKLTWQPWECVLENGRGLRELFGTRAWHKGRELGLKKRRESINVLQPIPRAWCFAPCPPPTPLFSTLTLALRCRVSSSSLVVQ